VKNSFVKFDKINATNPKMTVENDDFTAQVTVSLFFNIISFTFLQLNTITSISAILTSMHMHSQGPTYTQNVLPHCL